MLMLAATIRHPAWRAQMRADLAGMDRIRENGGPNEDGRRSVRIVADGRAQLLRRWQRGLCAERDAEPRRWRRLMNRCLIRGRGLLVARSRELRRRLHGGCRSVLLEDELSKMLMYVRSLSMLCKLGPVQIKDQ